MRLIIAAAIAIAAIILAPFVVASLIDDDSSRHA